MLCADGVANERGLFQSLKDSPGNKLPDVHTGSTLGVYAIADKLGEGGMGAVFQATHKKLKRTVALKILPQDRMSAEDVARFEQEMAAAGQLNHRNIVTAFDAGEANGHHFLAMELIDGVDLNAICQTHGQLDVGSACEMIRQAAVGLQHAHEHGMVHRDIKPSNLMLAKGGIVKILDLGLARIQVKPDQEELTSVGQMMGTLDYMAAEQGANSHTVDIRADIYSLGVTLYKLLTGVVAYSGPTMNSPIEKMMALANTDPPSVSTRRDNLPGGLVTIIDCMIRRNPDERYAEPKDVVDALNTYADKSDLDQLLATTRHAKQIDPAHQPTVNSQHPAFETSIAPTHIGNSARVIDTNQQGRSRTQYEESPVQSTATLPQPASSWKRPAMLIGSMIAVITLLCVAFPQVFSWPTKDGRIVVTVEGEEIEVTTKGNTGSFNDPTDQKLVTLTVDYANNRVQFKKAGLKAWTQDFELTSPDGGKVSVRFEPDSPGIATVAATDTPTDSSPANIAMSAEQLLEWAFNNGLQYINIAVGNKELTLHNVSQPINGTINKINNVRLALTPKTPTVLEQLNSLSALTDLTLVGSRLLDDQTVQHIGQLQSLERLGFECHFDINQLEKLPETWRRQLSFLNLRNDDRRTPITDNIVAKAAKLFPNLADFHLDCSEVSTQSTISAFRSLPLTSISVSHPGSDLQRELKSLTTVTSFRYASPESGIVAIPSNAEVFWCDSHKLTANDLDVLSHYKTLTMIISRFAEVDYAAIAAFEKTRTDCRIRIDSSLPPVNPDQPLNVAGPLVRPTSATSSNEDDYLPVENLISSNQITDSNYHKVGELRGFDMWVTSDRNGGMGTDYFDKQLDHQPVYLEFELTKVEELTDVIIWGYAYPGAEQNDLKDFELRFSEDRGKTFSNPIKLTKPICSPANYSTTIPLGQTVKANAVRMTITDNHYASDIAGGDRLGFDEIRFLRSSKPQASNIRK